MILRYLQEDDHDDYIKLIGQLTKIGRVTQSQFVKFVSDQNPNHNTIVAVINDRIVGCLTMLIEQKISHSFSCVMHIEDVVTDKDYRGKGISRALIDRAIEISKDRNCYKIILDCNRENVNFYKHLGFSQSEFQMCFRNHK